MIRRYVFSKIMRTLRGNSQRKVPRILGKPRKKRTTAELSSCTRCPFRCGALGGRNGPRRGSAEPFRGRRQGGVVISQQLVPACCRCRGQCPDNNSQTGSVHA